MAAYHGTLAAARCLGSAGITVAVAAPERFAPARWSRYARATFPCPEVQDADRFLPWLLEFGARSPGYVLYPTSDDLAWLISLHREELARHFLLYQPPIEPLYTLLNKERLRDACVQAGIDTPPTWKIRTDEDLDHPPAGLPFPVLIKPRTQVLLWPHPKGALVRCKEDLAGAYRSFVASTTTAPALLRYDPDAARPILQEYFPAAAGGIYNLSGFIDETGELFVVRASRKVLQRPQELGVGICFERAEVDQALAERVRTLCRQVGYYGVFETEFIEHEGMAKLIDFNPRFYGQMAFDISRGMPLPLFAWLAAVGARDRLRAEVERASSPASDSGSEAYCNRLELEMLLRLQRLTGLVGQAEAQRWRGWLAARRGKIVDAVLDRADPRPAVAQAITQIVQNLRHPRAFYREIACRR